MVTDRVGPTVNTLKAEVDFLECELKAVKADNERLRAALEPFAKAAEKYDPDEGDGWQCAWDWMTTIDQLRRARAALDGEEVK